MLKLTILTVNTHKGFAFFNRRFILHELREAVRSVSADLVFLQEVLGLHEVHSQRHANWPDESHYEFLADEIWPQYRYGQNAVYPEGHHGNALLSKLPITRHENRDVTVSREEKRGLLHCVLQAPGHATEIHTICVHLGLREAHRQQQLELLCTLIEDEIPRTVPLIVAGDFNDWRQRGHNALGRCAGLQEVFMRAYGRYARTFPARWPMLPLDRIYVRNVRTDQPQVLSTRPWSHLSDHVPLIAHVEVQ
ncbi:MAG TPA: endonuclease/exonuclease/phosphatase family protein [Casimicrobiaceae bacterium]|nr:endonuclease/exonuclease/phosphatase family protein [Casimicrobiaceae bacterium]